MRIIAGHYRGRVLKSPPSLNVRPTSDRLRETLFNILNPRIQESTFLDLCSGTGAVGIEGLSRGASHATFVDKSRKMCGLVEANLDMIGVPEDETDVVMAEASEFLRRSGKEQKSWDIVFFDPPYAIDYLPVLRELGGGAVLEAAGLAIVEHHHKNELLDEIGDLRRWRIVKQGDSSLSFFERK